jgi:hypothetical protein
MHPPAQCNGVPSRHHDQPRGCDRLRPRIDRPLSLGRLFRDGSKPHFSRSRWPVSGRHGRPAPGLPPLDPLASTTGTCFRPVGWTGRFSRRCPAGGVIIHITAIQRQLPLDEPTIAYAAARGGALELQQGVVKEVSVRVVRAPGWVETNCCAPRNTTGNARQTHHRAATGYTGRLVCEHAKQANSD